MDLVTLFEMDWYDRSPLIAVLQRNRHRWIHFSGGAPNRDVTRAQLLPEPERPASYSRQGNKQYLRQLATVRRQNATQPVPKLGINPKSMWQDPKGIYFYPVDFLLSGGERIRSGNQFGLDRRYYYIVDLDLRDPNGVDLGAMTWPQVEAIAKRNGWFEQMQAFRQLPADEQQKQLFSYAHPDLPGSFFWHFIDRMVKDGKMSWSRAYKGVSYVRDPNLSIIHNNEPDQVLVLDPRLIKTVESGENKQPIKAGSGSDSIEQWMHALLALMKRVRGEYGGELTWMKKKPSLTFSKGMGRFVLTIPERSDRLEVGLWLQARFGRAEDSMGIAYNDLLTKSSDQVTQTISDRVEQIAARKTDLLFKPLVPIAVGKQIMKHQLAADLELPIRTTIYNSDNRRYNQVNMHGEISREIDRVTINTQCSLHLYDRTMSASCNMRSGKHWLFSAQSDYNTEFNDPETMFASMADKVRENFANMGTYFAPKENETYRRNPRFRSQDEFVAFMGWVVINCGLSLNGQLRARFAAEVAAFESYADQRELRSEIAYVLNSQW